MRPLIALGLLAGLTACSKAADPKATAVCEQAADRWIACTREVLGEEMAQIAASKRDVAACAADPETVSRWDACMTVPCDRLLDCLDGSTQVAP